jgi:hypothetical protein
MDSLFFAIITIFGLALGIIANIYRNFIFSVFTFLIEFIIMAMMLVDNTIDYIYTYYNQTNGVWVMHTVSNLQPVFPLIPLILFLLGLAALIRNL